MILVRIAAMRVGRFALLLECLVAFPAVIFRERDRVLRIVGTAFLAFKAEDAFSCEWMDF